MNLKDLLSGITQKLQKIMRKLQKIIHHASQVKDGEYATSITSATGTINEEIVSITENFGSIKALLSLWKGGKNSGFPKFIDMDGLRWDEVEIMIAEKSIIIISARGKTVRVTSGEFGLINKTKGTPNEIYMLFASFSNNQPVCKDRKMTVCRAGKLLKLKFGINKTPIELSGNQYKPNFKITMGNYKNNISEKETVSLESSGFMNVVPDPQGRDPQEELEDYTMGSNYDDEEDEAGEWLKNHNDKQE